MTINNQTIIYDASLEGFISVLRQLVMSKSIPKRITSKDRYIPQLFEDVVEITTCSESDINTFLLFLKNRIHQDGIKSILYAYLSEVEGFEIMTLQYIIRGLDFGIRYLKDATDEYVLTINRLCSKVRRECHRFYGLMRFQRTKDDIYYARFEPDHNILPLIIPHFVNRFKDQTWIIHDVKRGLAVLYDHVSGEVCQIEVCNNLYVTDDDTVKDLWRCYFDALKIEGRINPQLQRRCMPKRYWKYLTEKETFTTVRRPSPYPHRRMPV